MKTQKTPAESGKHIDAIELEFESQEVRFRLAAPVKTFLSIASLVTALSGITTNVIPQRTPPQGDGHVKQLRCPKGVQTLPQNSDGDLKGAECPKAIEIQ
jgi:hypothetical protein